ncbi:MAG: hypothetical protein ACFCVH_18320 [Alphaproteobacteria bacterium]
MHFSYSHLTFHRRPIEPREAPPASSAVARIYARYVELHAQRRLPDRMTFEDFYKLWRSGRRG